MLGGLCVAAMFPVALLLAAAKDSNAPASTAGFHISSLGDEQFAASHILAAVESHDRTRPTEEVDDALCIKQVLPPIYLRPRMECQVLPCTDHDAACAAFFC